MQQKLGLLTTGLSREVLSLSLEEPVEQIQIWNGFPQELVNSPFIVSADLYILNSQYELGRQC